MWVLAPRASRLLIASLLVKYRSYLVQPHHNRPSRGPPRVGFSCRGECREAATPADTRCRVGAPGTLSVHSAPPDWCQGVASDKGSSLDPHVWTDPGTPREWLRLDWGGGVVHALCRCLLPRVEGSVRAKPRQLRLRSQCL